MAGAIHQTELRIAIYFGIEGKLILLYRYFRNQAIGFQLASHE